MRMYRKNDSGGPTIRNEENVVAVRQLMQEHPQVSVRHVQQDLHFHTYRLQATHEILPLDRPKQLNFCQQFIDRALLMIMEVSISLYLLINRAPISLATQILKI